MTQPRSTVKQILVEKKNGSGLANLIRSQSSAASESQALPGSAQRPPSVEESEDQLIPKSVLLGTETKLQRNKKITKLSCLLFICSAELLG